MKFLVEKFAFPVPLFRIHNLGVIERISRVFRAPTCTQLTQLIMAELEQGNPTKYPKHVQKFPARTQAGISDSNFRARQANFGYFYLALGFIRSIRKLGQGRGRFFRFHGKGTAAASYPWLIQSAPMMTVSSTPAVLRATFSSRRRRRAWGRLQLVVGLNKKVPENPGEGRADGDRSSDEYEGRGEPGIGRCYGERAEYGDCSIDRERAIDRVHEKFPTGRKRRQRLTGSGREIADEILTAADELDGDAGEVLAEVALEIPAGFGDVAQEGHDGDPAAVGRIVLPEADGEVVLVHVEALAQEHEAALALVHRRLVDIEHGDVGQSRGEERAGVGAEAPGAEERVGVAGDEEERVADDGGVVDEADVDELLRRALADGHGTAEVELELRPGVAPDVVGVERPHVAALVLGALLEPGPEQDLEGVARPVVDELLDLGPEQRGAFLLEVQRQIEQAVRLRERVHQVDDLALLLGRAGRAGGAPAVLRAAAALGAQRGLGLLPPEEDHEHAALDCDHAHEPSACAPQPAMQEHIEPRPREDAPAVALRAEELEVAVGAELALEHALVRAGAQVERQVRFGERRREEERDAARGRAQAQEIRVAQDRAPPPAHGAQAEFVLPRQPRQHQHQQLLRQLLDEGRLHGAAILVLQSCGRIREGETSRWHRSPRRRPRTLAQQPLSVGKGREWNGMEESQRARPVSSRLASSRLVFSRKISSRSQKAAAAAVGR
ncbi:hypothetical protein MPTK1_5g19530 [Marchantia polymorpha subsp. ruderalis]|uniref:Uncharacterized protein n=2 Tax=Marchantia polymorpha TaxID=3197 RepID=A0AAF6BK42_MARPO|nr:hypothetical protein MARPO_0134s0011 [Marchantia polymorpha]BBN12376.1 hypothetical protein Mp_5g19530 [Marchantia polymorpha subsp. ruderalis]|eukprot:PTQ29799.1 hypothetical protein MARPO_0134s0011 [Marchantia polymorpha]